jgi:hypothetical protein
MCVDYKEKATMACFLKSNKPNSQTKCTKSRFECRLHSPSISTGTTVRGTETPPQTTSHVKQFLWQDQCELKRTNQKTVKVLPHAFGVGNSKRALVVAGKSINQSIK